uniref:Uncharacterized protein n=1 Tax=Arundo donax TaxID=35708 RepID=A0A0A9HZ63_ARUDO
MLWHELGVGTFTQRAALLQRLEP